MKKILTACALVAALTAGTMQMAHAATQSFTGTISDSMCKKKHMMPGMSDAKCIEDCVKAGAKYVLVVGDKVYTLNGSASLLQAHAGKQVKLDGELRGDTITVAAIR